MKLPNKHLFIKSEIHDEIRAVCDIDNTRERPFLLAADSHEAAILLSRYNKGELPLRPWCSNNIHIIDVVMSELL